MDILDRLRGLVATCGCGACEDAAAEIERLRAALKECADELAEQLEGHYAATKDHPAMKRRYDRDMAPVIEARKLLGCEQSPAGEKHG